ncbi:sporulation phosphorelay system protein KapB [Aquibacillus rhizosphaerae]|uniref:Sporulation phosphorelay system protein KapB n=1 Tax=Aquibacillus rhizosphaerae TaxID=3051431 RepID=A0ABT7LBB1_9BACI|nr:sporulation phosphorelay system protein KapB [Aquibacillus sp. LR5S19]MDL4842542.1 sporulation phosphorelay system protein KapB [Aquibacillus sp. LR5S19]
MENAKNGELVRAHYKSGTYIGEVIEERGENYLIKVLAVVKHPLQGDLHNFGKTEDVFFHQRKALSYLEKMNVSKPAVHPFREEVPNYLQSLRNSVNQLKEKLTSKDKDSSFNQAAMTSLEQLEREYFK